LEGRGNMMTFGFTKLNYYFSWNKNGMAQVDIIRNGIIDTLLAISDKDCFSGFENYFI
jgi:hypothetical protein